MTGSQPPETGTPDDEISLLDLLIVLAKHKWLILSLPVIAGIVAALISLQMTEIYTGTVKLLPPQQTQSTAGILGQLGSLAGGAAGILGLKSPSEIYVGMLKSRTIADVVVDRFDLMKQYKADRRSGARQVLQNATRINVGKEGLITVEVEDADPKRAAALANAYVEELVKLTGVLAVTEAGQRRLFFELQLKQAKENLFKAELAAGGAFEQGGLAMVDAQGRSIIQTSALLRVKVAAKEVEINSMRSFAAEDNARLNRARQELVALREQLTKLEHGGKNTPANVDNEHGLKNLALLREVRYQEVLFELLARQYEIAKLDEAREGAVIQVLDKAVEPDRRTHPQRRVIVVLTMLSAVVAAAVVAFLLEALERARRDPHGSRRLAQLSSYLGWRK